MFSREQSAYPLREAFFWGLKEWGVLFIPRLVEGPVE